jgi:hypothetical protein
MTSPAIPGPDRNVQQPLSDEQKQSEQKRFNEYMTTHDNNAPSYPFNP